jgi:hypothetical protein
MSTNPISTAHLDGSTTYSFMNGNTYRLCDMKLSMWFHRVGWVDCDRQQTTVQIRSHQFLLWLVCGDSVVISQPEASWLVDRWGFDLLLGDVRMVKA